MTDNVIQFGKREPAPSQDRVVWRCNCGCLTFFIRADQEVECAQCGVISADCGDWRARSPEEPDGDVAEVALGDVKVTDLNSSENAIRRVVKKIDPGNLIALVVLNADGSISTWGSADTEEQGQWMLDQLLAAHDLMAKR